MPVYDYSCSRCNYRFELRQSFSSEPVAPCPRCANGAHRVIHSVPVVFKGSGWYVNDYGKRGSVSSSSADSKESAEPVPSTNGKSDHQAKGESKDESKSKVATGPAKAESKAEPVAAKAKTKAEKATAKSKED